MADRLTTGQRVVLVVGLGVFLGLLGEYLTNLGSRVFGWVAYAPLSDTSNGPFPGGLHPWARLLIWLALVVLWTAVSLAVFTRHRDGSD